MSTGAPVVSVIIAAYNAERTVAQTFDSALSQTHRDVEVVVDDDGSTDGAVAALTNDARILGYIAALPFRRIGRALRARRFSPNAAGLPGAP